LAMERAMWYGATGIRVESSGTVEFQEGSQVSIGMSGGVSGTNKVGDVGLAGTMGAGWGKGNAMNRMAGEIMVSLWHDERMVRTRSGELRWVVEHYNHEVQRGR
jgi:hypothetical protein